MMFFIYQMMLFGGASALTRFFTRLNSALTQYYTIPTWTASGDFEIRFDIYVSSWGGYTILGDITSSDVIRFTDASTIVIQDSTGFVFVTLDSDLPINQLITINYKWEGQVVSVSASSGQVGVTDAERFHDPVSFTTIGSNAGSFFVDGYLANVSLTESGGDNRFYALDEDLSTTSTIIDSIGGNNGTAVNVVESQLFTQVGSDWEGVELWTLPAYIFTGVEGSGEIPQSSNILISGSVYKTMFSGSGSNVGIVTGASGSTRGLIGNQNVFADGNPFNVTSVDTAGSVTARWQVNGSPPFSGIVGIDSVKELLEVASS